MGKAGGDGWLTRVCCKLQASQIYGSEMTGLIKSVPSYPIKTSSIPNSLQNPIHRNLGLSLRFTCQGCRSWFLQMDRTLAVAPSKPVKAMATGPCSEQ